jgi:hypothetical protein
MFHRLCPSLALCALLGTGAVALAGPDTAKAGPPAQQGEAKPAAAKRVDINSASKEELMKLPGVNEALAARILEGRPYLTKTALITRNIVTVFQFQPLRAKIVALPPKAPDK